MSTSAQRRRVSSVSSEDARSDNRSADLESISLTVAAIASSSRVSSLVVDGRCREANRSMPVDAGQTGVVPLLTPLLTGASVELERSRMLLGSRFLGSRSRNGVPIAGSTNEALPLRRDNVPFSVSLLVPLSQRTYRDRAPNQPCL